MKPTKAMLMTAGLGTRLQPFTDSVPKPLIPVLGVPCSEFAAVALEEAGVSQVVANIHHLPQVSRDGLKKVFNSLSFSDETTQLLGSAGGIKKALPILEAFQGDRSFYLLNADTLCSLDLSSLAESHERLKKKYGVKITLAIFERQEPGDEVYRELLVDEANERVIGLGEKTLTGKVYSGCAILEPEALSEVKEGVPSNFVDQIFRPAIQKGQAGIHLFSGDWMDIGSPNLWWKTQLELLERLETGSLSERWKKTLLRQLRRVGSGQWTLNRSSLQVAPSGWKAPCFWDGQGSLPQSLGPQSILYGSAPAVVDLKNGVGMSGVWVSC